ncbi:hypothetical protein JZ751_002688, partial [Albula glossodonta]
EKWQSKECEECECNEDNTVHCKPVECSVQPNITCDKAGEVVVTEIVDCCKKSRCEPKPVCVHNNTEYQPGASIPTDNCQKCKCGDSVDPDTELHVVECTPIECDKYCQQVGQTWTPPDDNCVKYRCDKIGDQLVPVEVKTVCPEFNPEECIPVREHVLQCLEVLLTAEGATWCWGRGSWHSH